MFVGGYSMDKNVDYNFVYKNNNITINDGVKTIVAPRAMKFIDDNIVEGDEELKLVIKVINRESVSNRINVTRNTTTVIILDDDG